MMSKNNHTVSYQELLDMLRQSQAMNQQLHKTNEQLQEMIQDLRVQVKKLQEMLFGTRSERATSSANKPPGQDKKTGASQGKKNKTGKKGNGRKPLPKDFPRHTREYDLPDDKKTATTVVSHSPA
jgi:hypothetical protein